MASISLLDDIRVVYYGQPTPLNQVATISAPDSRTITIQPWDTSATNEIEKAIQKSDLGVNPMSDGKIIRLVFPRLTEERRKDLSKLGGKMLETTKIAMRNVRREINEKLKKMEKDKAFSKDEAFRLQEEVQKTTDKYISMVDVCICGKGKRDPRDMTIYEEKRGSCPGTLRSSWTATGDGRETGRFRESKDISRA